MSENNKDYRMQFLKDVETALVGRYSADQATTIANIVAKALSGYEIMERCTELVPMDDRNEKLIKRYGACLMVDGKSEKTIYMYLRTVRKLSEAIQKPFTEIGAYDIRFFLALEKERGVSNVTLENTRANLSAFFQWMTNDEVIPRNPIASLKPIKCPQEIKKPFSEIEIDALRSACTSLKERALIEILLSSGVRVSELASMEVKDINQTTMAVHVVHGKGGKERITYTTAVCLKHLLAYLTNRSENDGAALFYNRSHEPLNAGGIRFILNGIAKRAGVENVHPHRFRRTFATGLARRGMEVQEIQQLLGHTSIETTMRYVTVDTDKVQSSYRQYIA